MSDAPALPYDTRIRVAISDDHPLLLVGIRGALEADGGFEVVGEARTCLELLPLVDRTRPDAVLVDFTMPGLSGFECIDRIRERVGAAVKIVVVASEDDPALIEAVFRHGASAYVVKTIAVRDLGGAIREALQGTAFHAYGFPSLDDDPVHDAGLSGRELEVLRGVSRGLSNREIGGELFVTEQTVKYHLTNVFRKLRVANRTEAACWALEHGVDLHHSTVG